MGISYQSFKLDLEALCQEKPTILSEPKRQLPSYSQLIQVLQELSNKGYKVLVSNASIGSVPDSIIVRGNIGDNIKDDFYSCMEKLGLPYISEETYTPMITKTRSPRLIRPGV